MSCFGRHSVFALFVLSTFVAPGLRAESLVPSVEDADALVAYALAHNLELRSAHWQEDLAGARVETVAALKNPVARAEWLHVQNPSNSGFGVGLEWEPPQPGVYGNGTGAARAEARAAKADFSERAADLEADVRVSAARIATLSDEIALADRSIETRRAVHRAVAERLGHGAGSRIDVSLAAVSLARGEQERELLRFARDSELAGLESLLGLPAERSLPLEPAAPRPLSSPDPAPSADTATLAGPRAAVQRRPQLQADRARAEAAELALSAERAKRWPWLSLQARYRRHDQSNYPDDVTLGVELSLPVLDRNPGPIRAAEASRRQARDVESAHRLHIERQVLVLSAQSKKRREIAEHYAQAIAPVLSEHAQLVKQALAGLELDLTALLTAEDMVTRGGIEYLEARLEQRRAEIALARALGHYGPRPALGTKQ